MRKRAADKTADKTAAILAHEAEAALQRDMNERAQACFAEIAKVLERHGCRLVAEPSLRMMRQGALITADVLVVAGPPTPGNGI